VYEEFKDPDGYYTANMVLLLSTVVNSAQVPEANWPRTAMDFLRPEFSNGQMVIVHPNMDDIVLFCFKQVDLNPFLLLP
jgi:ABC-type Fe3+ transport system substrate-binding protein